MENFDFNNIEKYLRNGGNPEAIAQAFANKLNTTLHAIDDEKTISEATDNVVDSWNHYIDVYFGTHKLPSNTIIEDWYIDKNILNTIIDNVIKILPVANSYINNMDDTISKFFNKFNI